MRQIPFEITVRTPCNENWEEMHVNECGKFCNRCSKLVVDFTCMTDDEIVKYINGIKGKICGRVGVSQLNRQFCSPKKSNPFLRSKLMHGLFLLTMCKPFAGWARINSKHLTIIEHITSGRQATIFNSFTDSLLTYPIKGTVVCKEKKEPMKNVDIEDE